MGRRSLGLALEEDTAQREVASSDVASDVAPSGALTVWIYCDGSGTLPFLRLTRMTECGDGCGVASPMLAGSLFDKAHNYCHCRHHHPLSVGTVGWAISRYEQPGLGGWFIQRQKNSEVVHRKTQIPTGSGWSWMGPECFFPAMAALVEAHTLTICLASSLLMG